MALASAEAEVTVGWTFAAVPSVTPTAKPAASPVAALVTGGDVGAGFVPCVLADGKELTADRFQKLLAEQGHAVLAEQDTGSPTDAGWTEAGSLDKRGHDEGWKLARRIDEEVRSLTMRVQQLLDAGWREVGIITDHGWLLLPGGLPKTTLPEYLAETRWGRCAVLKASSKADLMTVPWRWNQDVRIAPAPGISCFIAGREYAHGGLSVQECVLPVLTVRPTAAQVSVSIAEVKWVGLRCRVRVSGGAGCEVDLRTKAADASTTIADERKPVDGDGLASLAVRNPDNEGTAVNVVVLDAKGKVVARASTTVGG
jgi:hypothetical protein